MNETNRDNIIDLMNENTRLQSLLDVANAYGAGENKARVEAEAKRDTFYMDYRMQCDEETKALNVELERLRAEVAVLRDALIRMRDSTHTSAAVLRGMADFELQKAARRRER